MHSGAKKRCTLYLWWFISVLGLRRGGRRRKKKSPSLQYKPLHQAGTSYHCNMGHDCLRRSTLRGSNICDFFLKYIQSIQKHNCSIFSNIWILPLEQFMSGKSRFKINIEPNPKAFNLGKLPFTKVQQEVKFFYFRFKQIHPHFLNSDQCIWKTMCCYKWSTSQILAQDHFNTKPQSC